MRHSDAVRAPTRECRINGALLTGALVASLTACVDDPLLAPSAREGPPPDQEEEGLAPVWFTGTPEITAALALIDRVLGTPHVNLMVIVDGAIRPPPDLRAIPRESIRKAELVRATSCWTFGKPEEFHVLIVGTAGWRRR